MNEDTRLIMQTDFYAFVFKAFREKEGAPMVDAPYLRYLVFQLRFITAGRSDRLAISRSFW